MIDTNLNDDMVKLVEYTIVTIAREKERSLKSGTIIITDDLTGDAFPNARIAEWTKENPDQILDPDNPKAGAIKASTLRVYYRVLDRWPKEDLKKDEKTVRHDEQQLEILREIADKLGAGASPGGGGSGSTTKASKTA